MICSSQLVLKSKLFMTSTWLATKSETSDHSETPVQHVLSRD